jgi:hypothetical protein
MRKVAPKSITDSGDDTYCVALDGAYEGISPVPFSQRLSSAITYEKEAYTCTTGAGRACATCKAEVSRLADNDCATCNEDYALIGTGAQTCTACIETPLEYTASASVCINSLRCAANLNSGRSDWKQNTDWLTPADQKQDAYVTFVLSSAEKVSSFMVWNQNEDQTGARDAKDIDILYSTDGNVYTLAVSYTLVNSGGATPNPVNVIPIPAGLAASHWRIQLKTFYSIDPYAGLMGVRINKCQAPQDTTAVPMAVYDGMIGVGQRRNYADHTGNRLAAYFHKSIANSYTRVSYVLFEDPLPGATILSLTASVGYHSGNCDVRSGTFQIWRIDAAWVKSFRQIAPTTMISDKPTGDVYSGTCSYTLNCGTIVGNPRCDVDVGVQAGDQAFAVWTTSSNGMWIFSSEDTGGRGPTLRASANGCASFVSKAQCEAFNDGEGANGGFRRRRSSAPDDIREIDAEEDGNDLLPKGCFVHSPSNGSDPWVGWNNGGTEGFYSVGYAPGPDNLISTYGYFRTCCGSGTLVTTTTTTLGPWERLLVGEPPEEEPLRPYDETGPYDPVFTGTDKKLCKLYGDPHIRTFEGRRNDHYGTGNFWLVKSPGLWIQGHYQPRCSSRPGRSWLSKLAVGGLLLEGSTMMIEAHTAWWNDQKDIVDFNSATPSHWTGLANKVSVTYHAKTVWITLHPDIKIKLQLNWNVGGSCSRKVMGFAFIGMPHIKDQVGMCGDWAGTAAVFKVNKSEALIPY